MSPVCVCLLLSFFTRQTSATEEETTSSTENSTLNLDFITPDPTYYSEIEIAKDNGASKIQEEFLASENKPDSLQTLLNFLKDVKSPISSILELRGLLLAEKEEKVAMQNIIKQLKTDMIGIRYLSTHVIVLRTYNCKKRNISNIHKSNVKVMDK